MRVAFIDDDPNELKILHTYFNDLTDPSTISIDDFSSGEEFLSRFTAGLYDLVTLDIFTGDLTGVDVARKIRETDHNVRLVFSRPAMILQAKAMKWLPAQNSGK